MKSPLPNEKEIDELVQFLPRLYADGFSPIKKWRGGEKNNGVITMPWPEYEKDVKDFFHVASKECWCDHQYASKEASKMIESEELIGRASLGELKTMLTFCVRGERFRDGHMAAMVESNKIRRILERLKEMRRANV
jgi:hypothetical protein